MRSLFTFLMLLFCQTWNILGQQTQSSSLPGPYLYESGAIVRGDTTKKALALVFTGDSYAEGGQAIRSALNKHQVKAGFFFTGHFYRNPEFEPLISSLIRDSHYLGAHSDQHLLYCDWTKRDSLLVDKPTFIKDLWDNYKEMAQFGIDPEDAPLFLPPYEWYNDRISGWTADQGLHLINITYGTLSHADYTTPEMPNYRSSQTIYKSILDYEEGSEHGLNGFLLLVHIGVGPEREDKFYLYLDRLISELHSRGYEFKRVDQLIDPLELDTYPASRKMEE